MNPAEVLEFICRQGVKQLDLRFSDISGAQHHVTRDVSELAAESFQEGFGVDGSRIQSWAAVGEGDMLLIPDPATAFVDPFHAAPTLAMICDVADPITYQNYSSDPRWVAKKAELYLKNSGVGDMACFGTETDFFIFDNIRFDQTPCSGFYFIDTDPTDHQQGIPAAIAETMTRCGLHVERQHRVSPFGQWKIGQRDAALLRSADNVTLSKYIAWNVARLHGKTVTFMPKPLFGGNGSGMLTRQSLSHNGAALFAGEGYGGLSEVGLYYVGGLLKHARALSAIVAPTTNSYKRLVAGEAPVLLAYSAHNRAAVCRISERSSCPKAKGVEFRPPDPAANPYLAFAAMLMAGLDGVINQVDPGEALDEDIPWEEMKHVPSMPASLDEALDCLEDDSDFLLKSDVFSPDLVESFIEDKRRHESQAIRLRPHPYEFALYFDL